MNNIPRFTGIISGRIFLEVIMRPKEVIRIERKEFKEPDGKTYTEEVKTITRQPWFIDFFKKSLLVKISDVDGETLNQFNNSLELITLVPTAKDSKESVKIDSLSEEQIRLIISSSELMQMKSLDTDGRIDFMIMSKVINSSKGGFKDNLINFMNLYHRLFSDGSESVKIDNNFIINQAEKMCITLNKISNSNLKLKHMIDKQNEKLKGEEYNKERLSLLYQRLTFTTSLPHVNQIIYSKNKVAWNCDLLVDLFLSGQYVIHTEGILDQIKIYDTQGHDYIPIQDIADFINFTKSFLIVEMNKQAQFLFENYDKLGDNDVDDISGMKNQMIIRRSVDPFLSRLGF